MPEEHPLALSLEVVDVRLHPVERPRRKLGAPARIGHQQATHCRAA